MLGEMPRLDAAIRRTGNQAGSAYSDEQLQRVQAEALLMHGELLVAIADSLERIATALDRLPARRLPVP